MPESKGIALLKRSNLLKEKSFSGSAARRWWPKENFRSGASS
jgi:hypothetical protein